MGIRLWVGVGVGVIVLASGTASAVTPQQLANSKSCMACHGMTQKIVGPGFKQVADRYRGDKGAAAKLATKIRKGGSGAWGPVAMPPAAVTDAEAQQLATWILSQK
ncbi:c-type cytochrome [Jeongeupia naejangsanensis]|uniref:C-type cytochrome n=1 Tax=Jeongeupia naejangsanensis TaxID=613195 RepID=A0ABS2BGE3_9NEIS|nr:c-type cytochrome [Jeongeupia naejangsanensis]MBM3114687.1 c-type cytochrome [Jeongeupia naejangsanensis]